METFWRTWPQFSHLAFERPVRILHPCSGATISRRTLEVYGSIVRNMVPGPQVSPFAQVKSSAVDRGQLTRVADACGPLCPVASPLTAHAASGGLLRPERGSSDVSECERRCETSSFAPRSHCLEVVRSISARNFRASPLTN